MRKQNKTSEIVMTYSEIALIPLDSIYLSSIAFINIYRDTMLSLEYKFWSKSILNSFFFFSINNSLNKPSTKRFILKTINH